MRGYQRLRRCHIRCGRADSHRAPDGTAFEGYNLFSSLTSTTAYLMDNDGNFVHSWETGYRPGNAMYFLENGELLHTGNVNNSTFNAGGAGGMIQLIDWNGDVTWDYEYSSTAHLQHHDVEMLPNGNVLMIAWQYKTGTEATDAGRDPSLLTDGELWPDSVIEVQPTGPDSGDIVWQWRVWDHLVQDYDPAKDNYGVVADHPELIDLNYVLNGGADWNHMNSVDYNADLDQIVLSVHSFGEIWVIDHSTTTAEAASHSGSDSGIGGDLLYRWGNPRTYGAGYATDQKLFVQHDAEWIEAGLPGEGNILVFNNGQGRPGGNYSSIDEIVTPVNPDGSYTLTPGSAYGPDESVWVYTADNPTDFFAQNISGSQRLPNGNTLICDGPSSYFFEVTDSGETVWEYDATGQVFRVERYGPDYPGFDGTPLDDNPELDMYAVVDTGQTTFYGNTVEIAAPSVGEAFYGQDAHYVGNQPSYALSGDGLTVYDNVTGLTWQKSPDRNRDGHIDVNDKVTWAEAQAYPATLNAETFGGHDDWRLPTIKQLYSLIDFSGVDPSTYSGSDTSGLTPFIDTDYFDFAYGDTDAGERIIDSQWASSTLYVSTLDDELLFGVDFADGRIKGYGLTIFGSDKTFFVICVRGNTDYGANSFVDGGDGTSVICSGIVTGGSGVNTIGLLVKTVGRVTETNTDWFKIDDGSAVSVKCLVPAGVTLPDLDDYMCVTGIGSCEKVGEEVRRLILPRDQSDVLES